MNKTHQSIDAAREEARLLSQDRGEAAKVIAIRGRDAGLYETGMAAASASDIRRVYGDAAVVVETVYTQRGEE